MTLWYASIFLVAGTLLLGVAYIVVSQSLSAYYRQTEAETARDLERLRRDGELGPPTSVAVPAPERGRDRARFAAEQRIRDRAEARAKADQRRRVATQFSLALIATTVLSLAGGWLVAGRALRPVAAVTAAARRVTAGRLDQRIALVGPQDELKELADTFDGMLARLDAAFASQRRFVANASHELRTPLALMRTAVDVTLDDPEATRDTARVEMMVDTLRQAIAHSERLTESLLTLASSDRGLEQRSAAELSELVGSSVSDARARLDTDRLTFQLHLDEARVTGDAVLLERMIANLIDNAVRYNEPDGFVNVATRPSDGAAVLEVVNSGPPLDDDDVASLTEPFRRVRDERGRGSGVGLGLSIVASVARAHGGELDLRARPQGGLIVTVRLPYVAVGAWNNSRGRS